MILIMSTIVSSRTKMDGYKERIGECMNQLDKLLKNVRRRVERRQ